MIGLLLTGQLLVGLGSSVNMGEAGPGVIVGAEQTIQQTHLRGWWDSAAKTDSWQGWLLGGEVMTVTHGLIVGADARWRSSGDIGHKQTVWAMAGVALPSLEIIAKLPAYESYVDHVTSIGFRAQIGRLEIAPQLLHYQQPHSAGAWGITTQMLIRVGKELR